MTAKQEHRLQYTESNPQTLKKVAVLKRYVLKHGWQGLGLTKKIQGYRLGAFVATARYRYRQGKLSRSLIQALESLPAWTWEPRHNIQPRVLQRIETIKQYAKKYGWSELTTHTRFKGIPLGRSVASYRTQYRHGILNQLVAEKLEEIDGWSWTYQKPAWGSTKRQHGKLTQANHLKKIRMLRSYVARYGWGKFHLRKVIRGVNIGAYVNTCRCSRKRGILPEYVIAKLEQIPGWKWSASETRRQS